MQGEGSELIQIKIALIFLSFYDRQQQKKNQFSSIFRVFLTGEKNMLPSGFEPESKPREGFMIGRYTTGARIDLSTRCDLQDT